jgi:hypothetical protein
VRVKTRDYTMAWWHLVVAISLSVVAVWYEADIMMIAPAMAAESPPSIAQAQTGHSGDTMKPESGTSVTPGMGKEAVRKVWGDPAEIRRIRTCFGWQEEWVYRGDVQRFGVSERVLLFDEGEVLTEIK